MTAFEGGLTMPVRNRRFALALLSGLAAATLAIAAPTGKPLDAPPSAARQTIDPQPPMALSVEVTGLQKHVRGGVASVVLKVSADVGVAGAVVTAKAPGDLLFADGSKVKRWNVDLTTGGARLLPVEVLVPRDGRFFITAEVEGTVNGRPLHRGSSGLLEVGRRAGPPASREGAIEYLAVEAGDGAGEVQP